jgi:hypothetical protein
MASQTITTGPVTVANDGSVGSKVWQDGGTYRNVAANSATQDAISNYLFLTNFGFTIPTGATIDGISFDMPLYGANDTANAYSNANIIKLLIGGAVSGTSQATGTHYPTDFATLTTYGGASNLWGLTPTYSQINASDFGIAVSVNQHTAGVAGHTTYCYEFINVSVTVYYTAAAVGQPTASRFSQYQYINPRVFGVQGVRI